MPFSLLIEPQNIISCSSLYKKYFFDRFRFQKMNLKLPSDESIHSFISSKKNQFNSKWDLLSVSSYAIIYISFLVCFSSRADERISGRPFNIIGFCGLLFVLVDCSSLLGGRGRILCMSSCIPQKKNGKDFSYDGKIIGSEGGTNCREYQQFLPEKMKKSQQQFSIEEEKEIKVKYFGLSQFNRKYSSRSFVNVWQIFSAFCDIFTWHWSPFLSLPHLLCASLSIAQSFVSFVATHPFWRFKGISQTEAILSPQFPFTHFSPCMRKIKKEGKCFLSHFLRDDAIVDSRWKIWNEKNGSNETDEWFINVSFIHFLGSRNARMLLHIAGFNGSCSDPNSHLNVFTRTNVIHQIQKVFSHYFNSSIFRSSLRGRVGRKKNGSAPISNKWYFLCELVSGKKCGNILLFLSEYRKRNSYEKLPFFIIWLISPLVGIAWSGIKRKKRTLRLKKLFVWIHKGKWEFFHCIQIN